MCLTATSDTNGAPVVIEPCGGLPQQSWNHIGGQLNIFSNKCLDVTNGSTVNGAKMQIWDCTPGDINQEFTVTGDDRIAWTNEHECLDLTDGILTAGSQAQMWKCTDDDTNQVWFKAPW